MERKRIVIETGEDIADGEQYRAVTDKLEAINKKLTSPWVMPLILAIIGSVFTGGNYLLQRSFANADIYHNKVKEKVAELRATMDVNFYGNAIEAIDSLDEALQTYCELGPSPDEEKVIQNKLTQLLMLCRHRYYIDTGVANSIHRYTEFVASNVYKPTPVTQPDSMKLLYEKSVTIYKIAYAKLNQGIESLEK